MTDVSRSLFADTSADFYRVPADVLAERDSQDTQQGQLSYWMVLAPRAGCLPRRDACRRAVDGTSPGHRS